MKYFLIFSTLFVTLLYGCSNDDEISKFSAKNIKFVHQNGTEIGSNDCIDGNLKYAVSITVNSHGSGKDTATRVDYTINGVLHSMTFSKAGTQLNPINLIDGENIAQIVETSYTSTIYFVSQDEFEKLN